MKNKKKVVVLLIQIFVIIIFILTYKSYTDTIVKPIEVYMFARNMEAGTKITEKDIVIGTVSSTSYNPSMILASDIGSIIGRYTTTKVFKSNYCYIEQFGDLNQTDRFSSLDLTNARIISVPVDLLNDVGGYLEEGDRIDLIFSGQGESTIVNVTTQEDGSSSQGTSGGSDKFYYSKVVMPDLIVYKVVNGSGYKYISRANRYTGQQPENIDSYLLDTADVDSGNIGAVLLIVTPEQAEEIKARQQVGTLNILKRFDESETHETLGYVLGNYGKVFSGNANAETGSLQIISTIQDTDTDDKTYINSSSGKNNEIITNTNINSNSNSSSSNEGETNIGAAVGGSYIE